MAETPEQTVERVYQLMREPGVTYDPSLLESLKDALRRAIEEEREACWRVADHFAARSRLLSEGLESRAEALRIATAIRRRGGDHG